MRAVVAFFARSARPVAALALGVWALAAGAGNPPRVDYMLHCMGCHREDGSGLEGSVPSMSGEIGHFLRVDGGREYLVHVPGVSQSSLGDEDLAAVVNWMIRQFGGDSVPAQFRPYSAEEIGRLRQTKLIDVTATRERLLEAAGR